MIGHTRPSYLIAEIGSNHGQDLGRALEMISRAAAAGADAVKFQSLRFDRLYDERIETAEFREWFRQIELDESWYEALSERARDDGVDFLSSATYVEALSLLDRAGAPAFKIASPQAWGNLALVSAAAAFGKPMIISTGYCRSDEVARAIDACVTAGNDQIVLLHCVSKYPVEPAEADLGGMQKLASSTGALTGYSDHSRGWSIAVAAIALGACVIEKHVTLDRSLSGPDNHFAATFEEFAAMSTAIRDVEAALQPRPVDELTDNQLALRAAVELKAFAARSLPAGERIAANDLRFLRSSRPGLSFQERASIIGRRLRQTIAEGALLSWDDLDHE